MLLLNCYFVSARVSISPPSSHSSFIQFFFSLSLVSSSPLLRHHSSIGDNSLFQYRGLTSRITTPVFRRQLWQTGEGYRGGFGITAGILSHSRGSIWHILTGTHRNNCRNTKKLMWGLLSYLMALLKYLFLMSQRQHLEFPGNQSNSNITTYSK